VIKFWVAQNLNKNYKKINPSGRTGLLGFLSLTEINTTDINKNSPGE
jgi:hypothetical protein